VQVAELDDFESIQLRRPAAQRNLLAHDTRMIRRKKQSIGGDGADSRSRSQSKECSSVDGN
jgi:hypothetical protein